MKAKTRSRLFYASLIAFFIVVLDQASKAWILYDLMNPPTVIRFSPVFDLILTWNKGIGFGLFKAHTLLGKGTLILIALGISVFLGWWIKRTTSTLSLISLSMIIGGAIGNIIDRLRFGAVIDFIYVHVYIFGSRFPAFNVADSAITIGVFFVIYDNYMRKK